MNNNFQNNNENNANTKINENNQNIANTQNNISSNMVNTQNNIGPNTNNLNINNTVTNDSNSVTQKKKKKPLIIIIMLLIIFLIIFFGYPFVRDNFIHTPENVFKNALDTIAHTLNSNLDKYNVGNSLYDTNFKLNTDVPELSSLKDYTFGLKVGNDGKSSEAKIYMISNSNKEYSFITYLKNAKIYEKFSSYDKIIDKGKYEGEFDEAFKSLENINSEDLKYLITLSVNTMKKSLDKDNFSKQNTKINFNNKEIKVIKNTYTMNLKDMQRISKEIIRSIYNDKKALEIVNKYGVTSDEIKSIAEEQEQEESQYEITDETNYNIYMNNGKFAGFDITDKYSKQIAYYIDNGDFYFETNSLTVTGIKNKDYTDVSIKENESEIIKLKVQKFEENEISFDYIMQNENINGTFNCKKTILNDNINVTLNVSIKGENNFDITANLNEQKNAKIADFDESNVTTVTTEEEEEIVNNFLASFKNTPLDFISSFANNGMLEDIEEAL